MRTTHFSKSEGNNGVVALQPMSKVEGALSLKLSAVESSQFHLHESTIREGIQEIEKRAVAMGRALLGIREGKLYRAEFGTFEDYCRERWHKSDRWARRMMTCVTIQTDVLEYLSAERPVPLITNAELDREEELFSIPEPTTESVMRPLASLPPEKRGPAYEQAARAAGGKPTAKHVQVSADKVSGKWPQPNEHGVFEDEERGEYERFDDRWAKASIGALQVGKDRWAFRDGYNFLTPSAAGATSPFSKNWICVSRETALAEGAFRLVEAMARFVRSTDKREAAVARKIVDWAHHFLPARNKPNEPRNTPTTPKAGPSEENVFDGFFSRVRPSEQRKGIVAGKPGAASDEMREAIIGKIHEEAIAVENAIYKLSGVLISDHEFQDHCRRMEAELKALKQKFVFDREEKPAEQKIAKETKQADREKAEWVVMRLPVPGPHALSSRHRFMGKNCGWTDRPENIKAVTYEEAKRRCKEKDQVISLKSAAMFAAKDQVKRKGGPGRSGHKTQIRRGKAKR